jgi:hypothetical protein
LNICRIGVSTTAILGDGDMAAKIKIEAYEEDGVVFIPKELLDRRNWRGERS